MQLKIFTIYDSATQVYNTPFFTLTTAEALRMFKNLVNDNQSAVSQNPEDYTLHQVGTFTNEDAQFDMDQAGRIVCGNELVEDIDNVELFPAREVKTS